MSMVWSSNTQLVIAGNLTVGGTATTMATYDSKSQTFQEFNGASTLPGPVTAMAPANSQYNQFWAAGIAPSNASTYLAKYENNAWTIVSSLGSGTTIRGLQVMSLKSNHASTNFVPSNEALMVMGNIVIPDFGNASAALYNGTTYEPFILTSKQDGSQGSIAGVFASRSSNFMNSSGGHLALGLVVLIGLAISLGLIFLMVLAGIMMERRRRRKEGYVPMSMDRNGNLQRIPPESLLGGLNEKEQPPKI